MAMPVSCSLEALLEERSGHPRSWCCLIAHVPACLLAFGELQVYLLVLFTDFHLCLDVGACLKVNTRALDRGALHKKGDSILLLLTSEEIGLL